MHSAQNSCVHIVQFVGEDVSVSHREHITVGIVMWLVVLPRGGVLFCFVCDVEGSVGRRVVEVVVLIPVLGEGSFRPVDSISFWSSGLSSKCLSGDGGSGGVLVDIKGPCGA